MWGIVILNVCLILIALGLLLITLKFRDSVYRSEQQIMALTQELDTKLPLAAIQLKDSKDKLVALRQLIRTVLIQLPLLPHYVQRGSRVLKQLTTKTKS